MEVWNIYGDDNKWWDLHCAAEEGAGDYELNVSQAIISALVTH